MAVRHLFVAFVFLLSVLVSLSVQSIDNPFAEIDGFGLDVFDLGSYSPDNGTCETTLSCIHKGDSCKYAWGHNASICSQNNGTDCCAFGLHCHNASCIHNNINAQCKSDVDCVAGHDENVACVNNICQFISFLGDGCDTDSNCSHGLQCSNDSICTGAGLDQSCNHTICDFGLFCDTNSSSTCQNVSADGANCASSNQCSIDSFCSEVNQTCLPLFSILSGGACSNSAECISPLSCQSGICADTTAYLSTCSSSKDCNGTMCACSKFSGFKFCLYSNYNPCIESQPDLIQCMETNQCSHISSNPSSCTYTNCYDELSASISCSCNTQMDFAMSCFENTFCTGFPVWAVMAIIFGIIAIALVIAGIVYCLNKKREHFEEV